MSVKAFSHTNFVIIDLQGTLHMMTIIQVMNAILPEHVEIRANEPT